MKKDIIMGANKETLLKRIENLKKQDKDQIATTGFKKPFEEMTNKELAICIKIIKKTFELNGIKFTR